jgi:hypothetical protein
MFIEETDTQPTPWNRVPLPQLVKELPTSYVEPENALPCPQVPDNYPYPESDKSNLDPPNTCVKVLF